MLVVGSQINVFEDIMEGTLTWHNWAAMGVLQTLISPRNRELTPKFLPFDRIGNRDWESGIICK